MEKVRVGIVGFGKIAEIHHLKKIQECELYDLIGVCDVTEARRRAADAYDLRTTSDFDEFLKWDIDLVLISTHSSAHYEYALKAAAAKKHLLVEKPIALNARESEEMIRAARENGVMFTVYHNRHFDRDYCMVKAAVCEGLIGDIISLENITRSKKPGIAFGVPDFDQKWRVTALQGGGTLFDFGPHFIEQVLDLMEGHTVVRVFADVRNVKWGDAEDLFDIQAVFDNGVHARIGKYDLSYFVPNYKWLVVGKDATLVAEKINAEEVYIYGPEYELKRSTAVPAEGLHENIARHLLEGEDLVISADHALRVMKVIDAARLSAKEQTSVEVRI